MTSFVIVNNASDASLTPDLLAAIASALEIQLNRDVSTYWGGNYRVRAATPDNPPATDEVVAIVLDDLPDAPGAIAYHNWQGSPDIYAARNMCDSLIDGGVSLSAALSHELCETAGDDACNLWADDGAGNEWAHELCDAVESGVYTIGVSGVAIPVSDFVLPEFFKPGVVQDKYSFMGGPSAPFTTAPGGYQIQRASGTGETQVQGVIREIQRKKKAHWSSRTYRRGARLSA